jgi:hypothetical protein
MGGKKIKGKSLVERATSLAKLRDAEAHCAQVDYDPRHGLRLTEYHSPLADLIKTYPSVAKMEEAMLSRLLQAPVQREMSTVSGLMRITFLVAGATMPPPTAPSTTVRTKVTAKRPAKDTAAIGEETPGDAALGALLPREGTTVPEASDAPAASATAIELVAIEATAAAAPLEGTPTLAPDIQAEAPAPEPIESDTPLASANPQSDPPAAPPLPVAAVEETLVAKTVVEEEPLLFTPPTGPASPRVPVRTVAPARTPAKAADPLAEELFLSL